MGNFPYECSQDEVVGLFAANACAIADVRMVRNRDTDRPRGYFLEFEDLPSLERALGFDQYVLGGRPLRVNVAEGRPERRDRDRDRFGAAGASPSATTATAGPGATAAASPSATPTDRATPRSSAAAPRSAGARAEAGTRRRARGGEGGTAG